jgi:hypothetical protein
VTERLGLTVLRDLRTADQRSEDRLFEGSLVRFLPLVIGE